MLKKNFERAYYGKTRAPLGYFVHAATSVCAPTSSLSHYSWDRARSVCMTATELGFSRFRLGGKFF